MGWSESRTGERRRDPRVEPCGRVLIGPRPHGSQEEGSLVDVSACGLRLVAERLSVGTGLAVGLEIHLTDTVGIGGRERCVLEGTGRVVWVRTEEGRCEAGVRFDEPMRVRSPFDPLA